MSRGSCRLLFAFVGLIGVGGLCSSKADDAEVVKKKLFQAKKEYDGEVQKFKQAVQEVFDKREELARAKGDKKAVDQVKADREAFIKSGEPPSLSTTVQQSAAMARANLDKAYLAAVKDYIRLKEDNAADAVEKERKEFFLSSAFVVGKRRYLSTLKHTDVKTESGHAFSNNGTQGGTVVKLKKDGEYVPHSLFLHASTKGISTVSYPLGDKWTAFRVSSYHRSPDN